MSIPAHQSDSISRTTRFFYADERNEPIGPLSWEDLQRLESEGVISGHTQVIEETGTAWRPLASVAQPSPAAHETSFDGSTVKSKNTAPLTPIGACLLLTLFAPLGIYVVLRDRQFSKTLKTGLCLSGLFVAAPFQLLLVAIIVTSAFHHADPARRAAASLPSITDSTRFLAKGCDMYADEQSIRESNSEPVQSPAKPTPVDSPEAVAQRLHELYPKDFKAPSKPDPDGDRAIAARNRLKGEGTIWTEKFDLPVRVLKTGGAFQSALVEPLEKGITRRSQFWVLESDLRSMNDPAARVWVSQRIVRQKDFVFTFTGHNRTMVGSSKVAKLADMLTGIYDGKIPAKIAPKYLFEPDAISATFSKIAGDFLIYEVFVSYGTSFSPERSVEFAVHRNPEFERQFSDIEGFYERLGRSGREGHSNGGPLRQASVIVLGTQEFTTVAGLVKVVPVVEIVNVLP